MEPRRKKDLVRMLLARRSAVILVAAVAAAVGGIHPAHVSARPRLLASDRCARPCDHLIGVYKVRPRRVELDEAAGGTLTLRWSRWNQRVAIGSGHGYYIGAGASYRYPVSVRAKRVRHGDFTRLVITRTFEGETATYTLRLGHSYGEPRWLG